MTKFHEAFGNPPELGWDSTPMEPSEEAPSPTLSTTADDSYPDYYSLMQEHSHFQWWDPLYDPHHELSHLSTDDLFILGTLRDMAISEGIITPDYQIHAPDFQTFTDG
jgi:hypothetical protein